MITVTPNIEINESELKFDFTCASGPGGQNVNKVATAVQLRFDVENCPALSPEVRERLKHLAGKRVTTSGILIIQASRYRTQERNRQDAIDRLIILIQRAAQRPKIRRPTRPSLLAKKRRLEAKRRRREIKKMRRFQSGNEDL